MMDHATERAIKRLTDVLVAGCLLVALSPLLSAVALIIRLTSGSPVLYQWRVVGRHGRPFTSYKFRTMIPNADALKPMLMASNTMGGPAFKMPNDPRVTPTGRVLRRYSLDELPQLWSVLNGDMSLVGPRPPLQSEYTHFTETQKQKLMVKPGITCLWQVSGRNNIRDFDEWIRLDMKYISEWSLWLDVKILLRTIPAVLRAKGAS
jgi:lipopolysaccharide/colanic/teichoic acid biosynthesis glycosyltransferase